MPSEGRCKFKVQKWHGPTQFGSEYYAAPIPRAPGPHTPPYVHSPVPRSLLQIAVKVLVRVKCIHKTP